MRIHATVFFKQDPVFSSARWPTKIRHLFSSASRRPLKPTKIVIFFSSATWADEDTSIFSSDENTIIFVGSRRKSFYFRRLYFVGLFSSVPVVGPGCTEDGRPGRHALFHCRIRAAACSSSCVRHCASCSAFLRGPRSSTSCSSRGKKPARAAAGGRPAHRRKEDPAPGRRPAPHARVPRCLWVGRGRHRVTLLVFRKIISHKSSAKHVISMLHVHFGIYSLINRYKSSKYEFYAQYLVCQIHHL
jgi:hypothetical protein